MDIKWNIETGYVTRIPDFKHELAECEIDDLAFELSNGASEDDIVQQLDDLVQDEFERRISYFITNESEILEEIRKRAEQYKEEDEE